MHLRSSSHLLMCLIAVERVWSELSFLPSGSWVELEELIAAVSRRESLTGPEDSISSTLQGELERILLEAQLECERSRDRYQCGLMGGGGCTGSCSLSVYCEYLFVVHSPPQVGTPQSTGSQRPTSEDSDCVNIQVSLVLKGHSGTFLNLGCTFNSYQRLVNKMDSMSPHPPTAPTLMPSHPIEDIAYDDCSPWIGT